MAMRPGCVGRSWWRVLLLVVPSLTYTYALAVICARKKCSSVPLGATDTASFETHFHHHHHHARRPTSSSSLCMAARKSSSEASIDLDNRNPTKQLKSEKPTRRILSDTIPSSSSSTTKKAISKMRKVKRVKKLSKPSPKATASKTIVTTNVRVNSNATLTVNTVAAEVKEDTWQWHEERTTYESSLQALKAYHALHGDLVLPRRYQVPDDNGNDNKASNITFPPAWRSCTDLADTVYNMKWWQRHVQQRPERVAELNALGFVWERLQPTWNLVLEALVTYSSLHGNVLVPFPFVVPHGDDQWPPATWDIPLGTVVYRIRIRNDFLHGPHAEARRTQLAGLDFVWDVQEHVFRKFYLALRHYARLHECGPFRGSGSTSSSSSSSRPLCVPSTYVIPKGDHRWPADYWDYPLGAKCTAVRQKQLYIKADPHRRHLLDELGFHWDGNKDMAWLQVVHAAAIYSRLHQRQLDVPYDFVVPRPPLVEDKGRNEGGATTSMLQQQASPEDWPWPEHLWGLPLGQRLKDVRVKGTYLKGEHAEKRRRQLDTLGFVWKPKRGRRKKT